MKKKYFLITYIVVVIAAILFSHANATASEKPNVVLIVVDDLGWTDVGYNSPSSVFETPNIDKLAAEGIEFTNAYAGAANCAPSRAVLMSGQYTPRHGVYTVSPSTRGDKRTRKIIPEKNNDILADEIITLAEFFQSNGYATGHFGKWHLGADPKTQGFDHNVAGHLKGHPKTYFSPYNLPFLANGPKGEYLPDRITDEVIAWGHSVRKKPFFAYVPYYTVHTPLQAKEKIKSKYLAKDDIRDSKHATYAAMVESMDENIGRILSWLEMDRLMENTIIVFTSDNGGIRAISYQDPLRGGKGSYYEGGVRVPLLVKWAKKIKPRVDPTPVINADFFPTFAGFLNESRFNQPLDGVDLSQLMLENRPLQERSLFWHFPIYLQAYNVLADQGQDPLFRTRPGTSMRKGKWKLIHFFEDDQYELYDLQNDLGEHVNFAKYRPDVLNSMVREMNVWRKKINAPVPVELNPKFDKNYTVESTRKKLVKKEKRQ